jgi:hypothetical protein
MFHLGILSFVAPGPRRGPSAPPLHRVGTVALLVLVVSIIAPTGAGAQESAPGGAPAPAMALPRRSFSTPPEPYGVVAPWECSPQLRPGTRAFGDLLRQASGDRYAYEDVRPCDASWGIAYSQHKTGRAIDFMVDSRDPQGRADGLAVLQWLFEPIDGVAHARLRRLGVVEIIWDARIWTTEADAQIATADPSTWRAYDGLGCSGDPASQGTECHYDHFHFSLSAAGAAGMVTYHLAEEMAPPAPALPEAAPVTTSSPGIATAQGGWWSPVGEDDLPATMAATTGLAAIAAAALDAFAATPSAGAVG